MLPDLFQEDYLHRSHSAAHWHEINQELALGTTFFFAQPVAVHYDHIIYDRLPGMDALKLACQGGRIEVEDGRTPLGFAYRSAVRYSHERMGAYVTGHGQKTTLQAFCLGSYDFDEEDANSRPDLLATHRAYVIHAGWCVEVVQARPLSNKAMHSALEVATADTFQLAIKTGWNTPPSHTICLPPVATVYLVPRPPQSYLRWWVDHRAASPTVQAYHRPTHARLTWETDTTLEIPQHLKLAQTQKMGSQTVNDLQALWGAVFKFYHTHNTFALG